VIALIEIKANQIPLTAKSLFDPHDPAGLRCIAVLEGIRPGRIFTDSSSDLTWMVVWDSVFGAIYPGGEVSAAVFSELIHQLQREKMVFLGLWLDDPRWPLVQTEYDYEGRVLDFYDRVQDGRLQKFLDYQPDGTEFYPVNECLLERSVNRDLHLSAYPNIEKALDDLVGFFLVRGEEILCEALAGAEVMGTREIGIDTPEPYRQRGYATITCAKLVQVCEKLGVQTYWNCNKENLASVALARKLGYQTEREYKLLAWNKQSG
jgi:RimJ/RimL family protein N-acetyltransferase